MRCRLIRTCYKTVFLAGLFLMVAWSPAAWAQHEDSDHREVFIVPFSHLDLYWAGTQEECLSRGNYVIGKAIELAEKYPQFRFLVESEDFTANFVDSHRGTAELETYRKLVSQGRIEIAPLWAAIHQNEPRGEALVRNLVYGKEYARQQFAVDPQVAHLADIPGFTWQYPQILAKAATPYMVMTRMGPRDHSLFHWKAPDGSSAIVWNEVRGYAWGANDELHLDLNEERLADIAHHLAEVQATAPGPVFLPWGMDLWAPNERLVENVTILNQRLAPNHFHLATPSEFFRAVNSTPDIPVLSGEIPSSWAGITREPLWPAAMSATDTLLNAEKFATISYALGYSDYPGAEIEGLWKSVLKALDHNSDGQGGAIGDERKIGYAHEVSLGAGQILRDSLRNIADRVQKPFPVATPIVVFNPLSWTRDDVVRTHVSLYGEVEGYKVNNYRKGLRLVDEKGTSLPFQVEEFRDGSSHSIDLTFIAPGVSSLGYKTFYLVPADKSDTFPDAADIRLQTDAEAKDADNQLGSDTLENKFYRVQVDRTTGRVEIFDKELNRTVAKDVEIAAIEERGGDAQNFVLPSGRTIANVISGVEMDETGPVQSVLRITGAIAGMPVVQRIRLYRDLKRIDLENTVDWKPGTGLHVEQIFPAIEKDMAVRYGTPFGSVTAADLMPGAQPYHEDELTPAIWKTWRQIQDWIFAGNDDWGFTLSADHQLMIVDDTGIHASMLRGARFTPTRVVRHGQTLLNGAPPAATYVFRYTFTSGREGWTAQKAWRSGMAQSSPLIPVMSADAISQKPLPPEQSLLSLGSDNLVVTALKKADKDGSIILRVFDIAGASAESPIQFLGQKRSFGMTNLLEEPAGRGEQTVLRARPFEIDTLKWNLK